MKCFEHGCLDEEAIGCSGYCPTHLVSFRERQRRSLETRVIDPKTGGEKGSKLARYDLIPADALEMLAEHYGRGAQKYADRNWERGYLWSLSFAAMMRHAWRWWQGEDLDAETGSSHMVAVAWHAFALMSFQRRGTGTDNRGVPNQDAKETR